jgi:muramoyltetrapeptide carboxypeptidase
VQGVLTGGNLAVLVALMGTPFMPDLRGCVLFLEDVGEDPYKIDRLLCQLRLGGHLNGLAGVLLGSFSDAASPDEVLADYLHPLGCPVLAGWPAGHATPNLPLPMGACVALDARARTLSVVTPRG